MGLRIGKRSKASGDTHISVIHRVLVDCGYNDPHEKVSAIRQFLSRDIGRVEDLSEGESALIAQKLVAIKYGG